jgi:hypothetical protein
VQKTRGCYTTLKAKNVKQKCFSIKILLTQGVSFLAEWWSNMVAFEKFFWFIAIPFTVLFVLQLILTFSGMGDSDSDGGDIDVDSGFPIFTIKNFITFLTVFGWSGITFYSLNFKEVTTVIIAAVLGIVVMFIVAALFYFIKSFEQSGTMDLKNAVGLTAKTYIPIPEDENGSGKIHITFQGSLKEIQAMTKGERIPTGSMVKVVEVFNNNTVIVEKIKKGENK